jgi:hypothetical protein
MDRVRERAFYVFSSSRDRMCSPPQPARPQPSPGLSTITAQVSPDEIELRFTAEDALALAAD